MGQRCVAVLKWGSVFPHIPQPINAASLSSLQISLIFALSKGIEVNYLGEIF